MANFAHLQRTQQSATLSFKKTGGSASRPLRRRSALFEKWEEKLQAKPEVEVTRRGVVPTRYGEYATPLISPSNATATPAEKFDGFGKLSAGVSTTPEDTFTAAKQPERESFDGFGGLAEQTSHTPPTKLLEIETFGGFGKTGPKSTGTKRVQPSTSVEQEDLPEWKQRLLERRRSRPTKREDQRLEVAKRTNPNIPKEEDFSNPWGVEPSFKPAQSHGDDSTSKVTSPPDKHTSQTQASGYRLPDTKLQQIISGGVAGLSAQLTAESTVKVQDSSSRAQATAVAVTEKAFREMKGAPIFEVSGAGSPQVNGQYAWGGTETSGRLAFRKVGGDESDEQTPTIHFKPEDAANGAGWSLSINRSRALYLIGRLPVKRKTTLPCSMPYPVPGARNISVSQEPAPSITLAPGCADNLFQLQDLYATVRHASGEHVSLTRKAWIFAADELKLVSESAGNNVGQRNLSLEIARFCALGAPQEACTKMHRIAKAACQGMIDQQPDQHKYAEDNGFVRPLNLPTIPDAKADKTVSVTQLDHIPYLTQANLAKYGVKVLCLAMQLQSSFIDWQLRKEFPKLGSILIDASAKPKKYEQLGDLSWPTTPTGTPNHKLLNRMIAKAPDYGGNPGGILDTVRRMLLTQNLEQQEIFVRDLLALNDGKSFQASKDASTGICTGRLKSTMGVKDAPVKQTIVNVLFTPNKYKKFTGQIETPFTYKEMLAKCTEQTKQLSGSGYSKQGKSILRAPASNGDVQLGVDNGAAVFDVGDTVSISGGTEREELHTIKAIQHKTITLESQLTKNHDAGCKIIRADHDSVQSGGNLTIKHDVFRKGWDASGAAKTEYGPGGLAKLVNAKEPMGIDSYTPTEKQQAIELIKSCEAEEVRMVIEVQLYIDYFKRYRDRCHLWYDVARTENFTKLQDQFSSTSEMNQVRTLKKPGTVDINWPRTSSGLRDIGELDRWAAANSVNVSSKIRF